jgi:two-component system osmolarity sensor histidine kinase EnvZ
VFLERLPPRSLLSRTVLLIAALLLASQAAWFAIYRAAEREPRALQVAHRASSVVQLTRAALLAAQPERRVALLRELSSSESLRVYPLELDEVVPPLPDDPLLRRIAGELRTRLGADTQVMFASDDEENLWVSFHLGPDEFWLAMAGARVSPPFPWQWLGWGALVLLLSVAGGAWLAARINRPLKAMSLAAQTLGRGQTPQPLDERGALELVALSHAFNRMSADLARLDSDRALLLAGVSHDLRTPLTRLRLGVEMTCHDERERMAMAQDIDDMDHIIDQFIDFARPDAGAKPAGWVDLGALAHEVAESCRRVGIDARVSGASSVSANGHASVLMRALRNLVENAHAYAGGAIELHVFEDGAMCGFEVLDRGPGIPEAAMEAVKRPFARLDSARGGARGAGLGFAIVERIARMHHGRLALANRSDGGLRARLELPCVPDPSAHGTGSTPPALPG